MGKRTFDWDRIEIHPVVWVGLGVGMGIALQRFLTTPMGTLVVSLVGAETVPSASKRQRAREE